MISGLQTWTTTGALLILLILGLIVADDFANGRGLNPETRNSCIRNVVLLAAASALAYLVLHVQFAVLSPAPAAPRVLGALVMVRKPDSLRPVLARPPVLWFGTNGQQSVISVELETARRGGDVKILIEDAKTTTVPCTIQEGPRRDYGPMYTQPSQKPVSVNSETITFTPKYYVRRGIYQVERYVDLESILHMTCLVTDAPNVDSFTHRWQAFEFPDPFTLHKFSDWVGIYPELVALNHDTSGAEELIHGGTQPSNNYFASVIGASSLDKTDPIVRDEWIDIQSENDRDALQIIIGICIAFFAGVTFEIVLDLTNRRL